MFGGPGKITRGGGAGIRSIHAPSISRAGRSSMGGGPRVRGGPPPSAISPPSTSSMQVEESFGLVRENPLNFGMAIKLAPDLVEEIKRVEAQGGGARIKFDMNANNPNGNVIHIGDKIFKFTWSREPGDLCDIYEERQSGEDGNGLLVESGGTWRKLNVERELDESTKNHVKRRSEEAERKHKSRKAIVLDHQNPSMKNQVKALAAAETNPWRNFKNRKEPPFKKTKLDSPSGGPPKCAYKSSIPTTTLKKGKISSGSPLSSQPEQHCGPASPAGSGNLVMGRIGITDIAPIRIKNIIASSEKEMPRKLPHNIIQDKSKHSSNTETKPADLKSLIISLLQENQSKGMSLKALEKAIGEVMPNSARQMDPILKQVAVFQSPGRYLLKQGLGKENIKKLPSHSGSSPASMCHQPLSPHKPNQLPPQDPTFPLTTLANKEQEHGELNSTTPPNTTDDPTNKSDTLQNQPQQQLSDSKAPSGKSPSDSGSSSNSDSSDSGSSSPSHSNSEGDDASSSSRQASDEDVDIMSEDEPPQRPEPARSHWEEGRDSPQNSEYVSPKMFMSGNLTQPVLGTISSLFGDSPENSSPDGLAQSPDKRPFDVMVDIIHMDDGEDNDPSRGSLESRGLAGAPFGENRSGDVLQLPKGLNMEDGLGGERRLARISLEGVAGDKCISVAKSDHRKPYTMGKGKEEGSHPSENVNSMADGLPMANGRGSLLRREFSDLELGELRETVKDATNLPLKHIDRKNSFKRKEKKSVDSECRNSDSGGGKPPISKINIGLGVKASPQNSGTVICGSADRPSKRKALEKNVDDLMELQRSSRHVEQDQQGWSDQIDQHNRAIEKGNKSRSADAGPSRAQSSEGHGDVSRRMPANSTEQQQQNNPVRGVGSMTTNLSKKLKLSTMGESNGRRADASLIGTNDVSQKNKVSSSDEDDLYVKYEKKEPELKGPIMDASQYKEYVKEYQEKFESYRSLNKTLLDYRNEFTKFGKDLETYNGRDMKRYHETLKQMTSSFHRCGEKHKRHKKIYIVLYEELKHLKQMIKDFAASYNRD